MRSKILETRVIHWDDEEYSRIGNDPDATFRVTISGDVYKAQEDGRFPIAIENHIEIIRNDRTIFSCIFHTKAILLFNFDEEPMNDLVKLLDAITLQEIAKWEEITRNSMLQPLRIKLEDFNPEAKFNKAYEIREAAKQRKLIK